MYSIKSVKRTVGRSERELLDQLQEHVQLLRNLVWNKISIRKEFAKEEKNWQRYLTEEVSKRSNRIPKEELPIYLKKYYYSQMNNRVAHEKTQEILKELPDVVDDIRNTIFHIAGEEIKLGNLPAVVFPDEYGDVISIKFQSNGSLFIIFEENFKKYQEYVEG